ncbi:helix-turn-helix domain-containing protein [Lentzea flava]|uniref:HTH luxR-type domain-containing protein n=1 Tax=Lentzea flava TaxID=103732 RepID=A0ABQ2UC93_9PSEU|nr:helix-turn-helix transcriptional regulator [Lentzea flava]MCP2196548.1 regulatory protein, luxR family [Lentzea flava]GGU17189.1 hypothetical protein GCM10010178_06250 [Lentzea flava]
MASGSASALTAVLDEPALPPDVRDRAAIQYARVPHRSPDRLADLVRDDRLGAEARGEARLALGTMLVRRPGSVVAGQTELALAVADLGEARAARAMAVLADPSLGTRPVADHREWAEKALRVSDDPALLAAVRATLVHTADHELPELVRRSPGGPRLADAHLTVARALCSAGHPGRARAHLRTARTLSHENAGVGLELLLDWCTGRWTGLAERAEARLDTLPDAAEAALVRARLAVAAGEWATAETWFPRTGVDTPEEAVTPVVLAACACRIRSSLDRDDLAAAEVTADRAADLFRRKENWAWATDVVPAVVPAWLRAGRRTEAYDLACELAAVAAHLDAPALIVASHAATAAVCAAEGAHERALDHWDRARQHAARIGAPYLAAGHAENTVRARLHLGDPAAADTLLDVIAQYDELGATRDANRGRLLLRTHGIATHTRRWRRDGPRVLSPRERDVADLLSRDRSNQEIADTLLLSCRTVEHHVASVLRKLGVKSRREVALRVRHARQPGTQ